MVNVSRRVLLGSMMAMSVMLGLAAYPGEAAQPAGSLPVLTIVGMIDPAHAENGVELDLAELEALGTVVIETETPWHDGRATFEGVPLSVLMEHVGASGDSVNAVALNDYSAVLPISDFKAHNAILATKTNGEYMPVRNKGPFFIIYPYDSSPELKSQKFYSRSVWQVTKLVVE